MKLVVGNQKSYLEKEKTLKFAEELNKVTYSNVIICPSYIYFNMFNNENILLGSQNVSSYTSGATTGELSCEQLKSMGVSLSLVGHSERREKLHESIEDTNIKIKRLLENNMVPILCVGETKEEKDNNKTEEIVLDEIKGAFLNVDNELISKIIIAYEPIWSIGTGVIPTIEDINNIAITIKNYLIKNYNTNNILLYGGSVNKNNIDELNTISNIDGYLIGGASTKIDEFIEIIEKCQ